MGNAASCAPSMISSNGVNIKVLLSNGTFQIFTKPVKAGELMVENPGQFVCESISLKVGQRIQGLSADEELEKGQLYFLLPMDLLYSVLTEEEMASLSCKANKAFKLHHHFGKIFPVFSEFCMFPSEIKKMENTEITCSSSSSSQPQLVESCCSKQRSWKPALETIVETPCKSSF